MEQKTPLKAGMRFRSTRGNVWEVLAPVKKQWRFRWITGRSSHGDLAWEYVEDCESYELLDPIEDLIDLYYSTR